MHGSDRGVRRRRGGQGLSDAHALQLVKAGQAGVTVGVTVESQERISSSSPAVLTAQFVGGMPLWK